MPDIRKLLQQVKPTQRKLSPEDVDRLTDIGDGMDHGAPYTICLTASLPKHEFWADSVEDMPGVSVYRRIGHAVVEGTFDTFGEARYFAASYAAEIGTTGERVDHVTLFANRGKPNGTYLVVIAN